ncbi:MAG: hypothetical protein ACPW60_12710 [Methylohalobius sp. ZOD2]
MNDDSFLSLFESIKHAGELRRLDRETRRRFGSWLVGHFENSKPADVKAWECMKELRRLEDQDAIDEGADPAEIYAGNLLIPVEDVRLTVSDKESSMAAWETISLWHRENWIGRTYPHSFSTCRR